MSFLIRSRAVSRPFLCCASIAFTRATWQICSSSFLTCVTRSMTLRLFFAKSGDWILTLVFRTDADTREPHVDRISGHNLKHLSIRALATEREAVADGSPGSWIDANGACL